MRQFNSCVVVRDSDNHINLVCLVPNGMSEDRATSLVRAKIDEVISRDPEEWNYEIVAARLESLGLRAIHFVEVSE